MHIMSALLAFIIFFSLQYVFLHRHENFLEAKSHPDWKDKSGSVEISCKGGKFQDSEKNKEVSVGD